MVLILILYVPCVAPISQNVKSVSIPFFSPEMPGADIAYFLASNEDWSLGSFPANGSIGEKARKVYLIRTWLT